MIIYEGVTSSGTRYAIDDSYMARRGSAAERTVIDEQRKAAKQILMKYAVKEGENTWARERLSLGQ